MTKLQMLPIPPLEQTINNYLIRIQPLLTDEEYSQQKIIANNFLKETNLHKKLLDYATSTSDSWLKATWDESYLTYRNQLNANMNYAVTFSNPFKDANIPLLCSLLCESILNLYNDICDNTLPQDYIKQTPLCMEQYKNMFGGCRLAILNKDELFIKDKFTANHIVVMYNNNMYVLDIDLNDINTSYIAVSVQNILQEKEVAQHNVGIITTAKRDTAANLKSRLEQSNKKNFDILETSVFILCLDEISGTREEIAHHMVYGSSNNRYFDKTVQVIVNKDGTFSFNNEHTGSDGAAWMNVVTKIYNEIISKSDKAYDSSTKYSLPKKLTWDISNEVADELIILEKEDKLRGENFHISLLNFNNFGTKQIKELGTSPDAFFHLSLQLAYYNIMGHLSSTYEAVSMRHYHQGRTECMRPATSDVLKFVEAVKNNSSSEQLKKLAFNAMTTHSDMIKVCQKAQGPERHLTGMQAMIKSEVIPAEQDIFKSDGYKKLKYDVLSTSGLSFEPMEYFGFGPVVEDGYGIGYNLCNSNLKVCTTSFMSKESTNNLNNELYKAMEFLYHLLK